MRYGDPVGAVKLFRGRPALHRGFCGVPTRCTMAPVLWHLPASISGRVPASNRPLAVAWPGTRVRGLCYPYGSSPRRFGIIDAGLVLEVVRLSRNQFGVNQTLNSGWIANLMIGRVREWNWLGLGWQCETILRCLAHVLLGGF